MSTFEDFLNEIFVGQQPVFYAEFEAWVKGSRRFKTFASSNRVKIRTKLKHVCAEDGMMDLRTELETAALLLRETRFTLEYEKYAASKQRGPDFTVTFKTHTEFNVEVRRIRGVELGGDTVEARTVKLMEVLCDKVGQMPPGIINLLWLVAERAISEPDLTRAVMRLRDLADHKNENFFTRRGFKSAADFLKQFQRLSGIVMRQSGTSALWLNALARHKVPPGIMTAIQRLEAGN